MHLGCHDRQLGCISGAPGCRNGVYSRTTSRTPCTLWKASMCDPTPVWFTCRPTSDGYKHLNVLLYVATKGLKGPRFDSKQRLDHSFPIMSHFLWGPPRLPRNGHQEGAVERQWQLHTSIQDRGFDYVEPVAYSGIFFFGEGVGSTNSVEDRGQRERGSGGGSPLVRDSGGSCDLVQEMSFHIVKFS